MAKTAKDIKWLNDWTDALFKLDVANPWFGQTVEPDTPPAGPTRPSRQLHDETPIGKPFKLTK